MKPSCITIYDRLFAVYGECGCPLVHASPFQLLIAVMLSAQCTDVRVNLVTQELFRQAPDAAKMAQLSIGEIETLIKSCGLYANKAKNIRSTGLMILEKFAGKVPQTMEELIQLPGIGRKSANVVLGNAFATPGFPVDTHVNRLLNRLGVVKESDPEKIEAVVNRKIAPEYWTNFSHLLITHGRQVCKARNPDCENCVLTDLCPKINIK